MPKIAWYVMKALDSVILTFGWFKIKPGLGIIAENENCSVGIINNINFISIAYLPL